MREAEGDPVQEGAGMRYVAPDGRVFETFVETFVFTRLPLVVLRCLTEYWIDGEPVEEGKFWKCVEVALGASE